MHRIMRMIETFRGQAHTWMCDVMGHLNTRHIMAMFDDASTQFLSSLMEDAPSIMKGDAGWADVKVTLELKREVPIGHLVRVRSGVVRIGTKSLTYRSVMTDPQGEFTHAVAETVTVAFDLARRKAVPVPDSIRRNAKRYAFEGMETGMQKYE